VTIKAERSGSRIVIHVIDTGIGISSTDLPRIWDRLFRGDRSRTERGLGLGLSFVQAIVKAHGGSVGVASEPSQGTTVTITLPAPPAASPVAELRGAAAEVHADKV
jgi:signal transduction histidine kinase